MEHKDYDLNAIQVRESTEGPNFMIDLDDNHYQIRTTKHVLNVQKNSVEIPTTQGMSITFTKGKIDGFTACKKVPPGQTKNLGLAMQESDSLMFEVDGRYFIIPSDVMLLALNGLLLLNED